MRSMSSGNSSTRVASIACGERILFCRAAIRLCRNNDGSLDKKLMNSFWTEAKDIIINSNEEYKTKFIDELDNKMPSNYLIDCKHSLKNEIMLCIASFCCKNI